ncbi:MAG: S8 family serine peptidase [Spirochaetales bacterium]|nr:S8 family serine peptidase [Spirochaetales bacterium]
MIKVFSIIIILLCMPVIIFAQSASSISSEPDGVTAILPELPELFPKFDRKPAPARWNRGALTDIPIYDNSSDQMWQMDLRCSDLSQLDLRNSAEDLLFSFFDSRTIWPKENLMPTAFDWKRILEFGKNPGLSVRELHGKGITGQGVGIAIIDQTLLLNHDEYANQLRLYEEINTLMDSNAQMHGAAVASIAVGKSVGVAPDADLYFITTRLGDRSLEPVIAFTYNFTYLADAVRRVLEINELLPAARKIRVISISVGWSPSQKGYDEITAAVNEAKDAGIFVVSSSLKQTYGFNFQGLGRDPLSDPDLTKSYKPGLFWGKHFFNTKYHIPADTQLLIPMDSRATASPFGADEYAFYREGGWSWSIPYIAGVYALAAQVDPDVTPGKFWESALETGDVIDLWQDGKLFEFGKILDPVGLVAELQKGL